MRNIRLLVAYDGTYYHGFQRQLDFHGPTIQGTIEKVWQVLTEEEISLYTAGRTDAGVHAAGQVVNFKSEVNIPSEKVPKAFNSILPRDIRILSAQDEDPDFNARMSAKWKRYDYRIDNQRIPDVFTRLYSLHEPIPLNIHLMKAAAEHLEGRHSFRAFAAVGGSSKTFERTLFCCRVMNDEGLLKVSCVGDGFLYKMVRIIVGTLLQVGKGRLDVGEIPRLLLNQERRSAPVAALAQGLTLTHVHFGAESPWQVYPELSDSL